MKAVEEKFLKFIQAEAQFKIPIYQRLYSWTTEHCQTLIDDIKMLLENPSIPIHFMGSVVYIDEKGQATLSSTRELLVIDGQQRLTTFTLIFVIIENAARNGKSNMGIAKDEALADKIRETCLVNKHSKLANKNKLILTKTDNSILQQLINFGRGTIENNNSNLIRNYDYISLQILELIKKYSLDGFYDNLNKLMIVDVALFHNTDNPQQTFESLNATGKELEDGDLIRNFLLMNLPNETQIDIYEKYWYPIESLLKESLTNFFHNYLYMEKGVSTNISNLYKEFKIYFYNNYTRNTIAELAARLNSFSKYYNILQCKFENIVEDASLKKALQNLNRFGFDSYIPLLLPIIHEYKVGQEVEIIENVEIVFQKSKLPLPDLLEIIKLIEAFLLRRSVCGIPTNSLNPIFRTMWTGIDKKNIKSSIISKFQELEWNKRFPNDDEFKDSLVNSPLYGKNFSKIILMELEKYQNKEANENFDNFQIEHIMPKTDNDPEKLSENWRIMLGENWRDVRTIWVHRLGNLTLTGYNPEMSDSDYEIKLTMPNGFQQSSLRLNQYIAKHDKWNETTLIARAEDLANKATKIWKYL